MSKNPAREKFLPLLSPYVDGELTPQERQEVEQHLANNKESAMQVADFRAGDALMRHALEMQADSMDWKAFTDDVMSKVAPQKLPLLERLKLTFSEMFTYQRGPMLAGFAGAAVAIIIAVPVALKFMPAPEGYGASSVTVQTVSSSEPGSVKPLVMNTDDGDAIIWVIEANPDGGKKKRSDEHSEETLQDAEGNQGAL